jgi:lysophospholipase L1-like esterase
MNRRIALLLAVGCQVWSQEADPKRFAAAIAGFLELDKTNPPPRGGILFIGSSIFRQWKSLGEQMAPLPVFNRAFGGSRTNDILYYMDQVVLPYAPRIIVYYCGSNDVNGGIPAAEIAGRYREFVRRVQAALPETLVFYVSINRAPQKREKWDVVDAANAQVNAFTRTDARLGYIDVNPALFDKAGEPRLELYQKDRLHFLEPAYAEFTAIIRPVVEKAWKSR